MKNLLWGLFAFATLAHAQGTVTDIDGNTYDYLTYGTQQWTVENAAMETYRDGTPIPQVTDATQWSNLTTGAWCYYDNDPAKGKLYNWYAVAGIHDNDPNTPNKEFAPEGWHVPTDAEWTTLEEHLIANAYNYDGTTTGNKIAKSIASTTGWNSSTYTGAIGNDQSLNNSSGFNAFPEGSLYDGGSFFFDHDNAFFWSSTEGDSNNAWSRVLSTNTSNLFRSNYNKDYGFSVRFIQNSNTCSEVSINASATEVCVGEEVTLNVNNLSTGTTPSCYGSTNQIFADWTELAPNAEYVNIIKHNDIYYLRSNNDVLQSVNINGSWVSMNFQNQIGHQCSPIATLFDFDWADRLQVATLHNSLYAYENGNWINNGLSGYGCSGRALTRLANNRIIVSKWGYLRDLYISDDNGSNWTNVTNVNNDYRDIIVADNGTVFACGVSNTASMTGLIKSTDNGNSFFNISSELGINHASTLSDDCEGNLYVLAENNIYKSTDEGENWTLFSNTPFNSTVTYSFLLPISSDVLFLFGRNANEIGLYESNNGGATWHELTNPLSDLNTIRELKLIDNVLVILSDEGVFGKTVEFSTTTYLWSTGDTTETVSVTPTETTEYWVDVTTNGVTCREYVTIDVTTPSAPTGNPVLGGCSGSTVSSSNSDDFIGENLQWYAAPSGGTALPESHPLVDGTYYYISQTVDGCESSDRFEFLYLAPEPTITIESPTICEGDSTTVSVSSSPSLGTATFLWNTGETSDSVTLSPTESTTFWVDQIYNSGAPENIQTVCRYFFGITVDSAPEAPDSGGDISECETIAAQSLVATASAEAGESITWYDAATGGSIVADPSLSAAGTVTYYAEATNDTSGCASLTRTAVTLTITSVAAPTGDAVQSFCDNVTVSDLSASGSNIQWYDAATGGNVLDPGSALSDGQLLYASQTENSCESVTRLEVSVEIDIIPDPILITTELEFCLAREATLADLEVDEQGFALEWYDSFSGGNMLPMDTLLEDGVSYYATLYDAASGCESLMRLEVVPTVIPCEVVIYNAISLNDNGINDYMVIENAEYFPDNSLEIYNRDGHLLYSQTQYGIGDNLFRGIANVSGIYGSTLSGDGPRLPTGSYLYVFKYFNPYEQQEYTLKGFLTINSN